MPERGAKPNVHPVQRRVLDALAALSSPLLVDDYLELINPLWSTRELRGRIEEINNETSDAATVLIKPGYSWGGHEPGQYLRIGLDIEGVRHWRAYSLTSDPQRPDGLISITVKNVDEGKVSPYLVRRGRPGTIVSLGGVEGEFVLPAALPDKLLFISAGSGITPIMSMLRHLDQSPASWATSCSCIRPATPTRSSSATSCATWPRRHERLRPARAVHRRQRPDGPRGPRPAVPGLARARHLHLRPERDARRVLRAFEQAGIAERLHMERFQPKLGLGDGEEGEGGTITFLSPTPRPSPTAQADPRRRRGGRARPALRLPRGHLPHLRRRAALRPCARPAQRQGLRRGGRGHPYLHPAPLRDRSKSN